MIPYIMTDQSITLMLGSKPVVIPSSHVQFETIRDSLRNGVEDVEFYRGLVDIKEAVVRYMKGYVRVEDGVLTYKDRPIDTYLTRKILAFLKSGEEGLVEPLVAFLERLQLNPSYRAQQQLYQWVEKANLPITPDGFILAFKRVRKDYWDHNTGKTFFHKVGAVLEMPRSECDEDPDRTCSAGIHFCSIEYLKRGPVGESDDPVMIVKIDPADVTAIPRDYNDTKGRCCRMEVVDETSPIEIGSYFTTNTVFEPPVPARFRYWPGQVYETMAGDEVQLLPGTTEDKAIYELDGNLLTADPQGVCDDWDPDNNLDCLLDDIDPYKIDDVHPHDTTTPLGWILVGPLKRGFFLKNGEHVHGMLDPLV
ncbi:hypothetical protein KNJ79_05135 [Sphingopyxis indica]|uniref:hypothetical protein n=1 Tax=Sphingopyxis indica TaxID=436663 RepID=UPI00293948BB|nr:hypothetical protein [Sphingopyxis indica]WOF44316.1 hypothetical protein KNJ79_05135 [Sphingopyxis indica]